MLRTDARNELAKRVGLRISEARRASGMTSDRLATAIGVTRARLSIWENGRGLPDLYSAKKLADVTGASIDQLLANGISAFPGEAIAKPPADPDDRLEALEERVDLLLKVLGEVAGDRLAAALAEAAAARSTSSKERRGA